MRFVGAEVLLYGYGLVCLSMLVFNVIYGLHLRSDDKRLKKRIDDIFNQVEKQIENIHEGKPLQSGHSKWMRKKLSKVNYLIAFDHFLDEHNSDDEDFQKYLQNLQPVFLYLTTVYWKREAAQAAYYCYFLARHRLNNSAGTDQVQKVVLSYLKKDNLYCRINAFKALCIFGSPDVLAEALTEIGKESGAQLHEKIITEALMTYKGDAGELIERFWAKFDQFPIHIQRAILDYIRFKSGNYHERMEEILRDTDRNKELRFSAIRYFGKYPDPAVQDILLDFVKNRDPVQWEYAAISASSLAGYPGEKTVEALLDAMHSPNWYIRYNASASLEGLGLSYEGMLRILAGDDRYAREMLSYRMESKRLENQEREAVKPAETREEKAADNADAPDNGKAAVGI